jgi:hypothetical protein
VFNKCRPLVIASIVIAVIAVVGFVRLPAVKVETIAVQRGTSGGK